MMDSPSDSETRCQLRIAVLEILMEETQAARAEYASATQKRLRRILTSRLLSAAGFFMNNVRSVWLQIQA